MSDRLVLNIMFFQTQKNSISKIGALLKGVSFDLRARNSVHARHRTRNCRALIVILCVKINLFFSFLNYVTFASFTTR